MDTSVHTSQDKLFHRRQLGGLKQALMALVLALGSREQAHAAVKISSCTVTTPPTMVFVTDLLGGLTSATSFSVSCTTNGSGATASFTVALSAGTGTVSQRKQKKSATDLTYNLYQDASHATVWGDGTTGTVYTQAISGNISNQPITIYGLIDNSAANKADPPGAYTDPTITLTLGW